MLVTALSLNLLFHFAPKLAVCFDMIVSFIQFCCFEQVEVEEEVEEPKVDISANTIVRPAAGQIAAGRPKTD